MPLEVNLDLHNIDPAEHDQDNNVDPKRWGKSVWDAWHSVAAGYPDHPDDTTKTLFKSWFYLFQRTLPCSACRTELVALLKVMPIEPFLKTRDLLFQWTVNVHNNVTRRLQGPAAKVLALDQAKESYYPYVQKPSVVKEETTTRATSTSSVASRIRYLKTPTNAAAPTRVPTGKKNTAPRAVKMGDHSAGLGTLGLRTQRSSDFV